METAGKGTAWVMRRLWPMIAGIAAAGCAPGTDSRHEAQEALVACSSYAGTVLAVAFTGQLPGGFELRVAREARIEPAEFGRRIQSDLVLGAARYQALVEPIRAQRARERGEALARSHLREDDAEGAARYYRRCLATADRLARA